MEAKKKPLYRKVNTTAHREAVGRIDKEEALYHLVFLKRKSAQEVVRTGESTYWSGLYVDDQGILRVVNLHINETSFPPSCKCCTHTFNGKVFTRVFPES